jgi:hypothetical protein
VCEGEREREGEGEREQSFSGIKFTNQLEVVDAVNLYSSAKSENIFVFHSSVRKYSVFVQRPSVEGKGGLNMKEVVCVKAQCQKVRTACSLPMFSYHTISFLH